MKRLVTRSTAELLNSAQVDTYRLVAANGRPIRKASKVILEDGRVFKFLDLLSKKEALANVGNQLQKISIDGRHLIILEQ